MDVGFLASISRQNRVSPDAHHGRTSGESRHAEPWLSPAVAPLSNSREKQTTACLSRKELERRRAHLESRMRLIQEHVPHIDEIQPEGNLLLSKQISDTVLKMIIN